MTKFLRKCSNFTFIHLRLQSHSTTIDQQEIEQFKKLAKEWWHEFGSNKPLHSMNKLRVPFVRDGLINEGVVHEQNLKTSTPLKNLSILDVGCGGGILSEPLCRLGANVTGIDANPGIIDVAKKHAEKNHLNINYLFSSIEDHSKCHFEKYDSIVASEILEHVTEKEKFLSACSACLKPLGSIFITTINNTALASFLSIFVAETVLELVPKGIHQPDKFIEPYRLQRMLEDCNLKTKVIHGMFYNVFTNNWHLCSNNSVNYCIHAVKIC
ncbi:hypothetical protein ABEB36_002729 [Hypothenemus hampei]|uniref:Ubiquinone biosynthesis O-methyltransferase, mitochondrial n=1 Tax=Hypothenemus hampei TaxID=57062 RepID=A0ABD1F9W5_HYPHA